MEEAAIQASEAGVDIDMMSPAYMMYLEKLVESGKIPEALVDESAFRVLMMKNQLGLFENPFAGLGTVSYTHLHSRNGLTIWLRAGDRKMTNIKFEKIAEMTAAEDYEIC